MGGPARLEQGVVLAFDATFPLHRARMGRHRKALDDIMARLRCRLLLTDVVAVEIRGRGLNVPQLFVEQDSNDLLGMQRWMDRVGARGHRHAGEASTFVTAEALGGIAVVDDREARAVGRRYGLRVHGSLWVMCAAVNQRLVDVQMASAICDELLKTGIWWPIEQGGLVSWATDRGLLRKEPGDG